jgi:hypothetical protein
LSRRTFAQDASDLRIGKEGDGADSVRKPAVLTSEKVARGPKGQARDACRQSHPRQPHTGQRANGFGPAPGLRSLARGHLEAIDFGLDCRSQIRRHIGRHFVGKSRPG